MKKLKCELCGSEEFVKKDGYFVCEGCGTKYTPEEASRLYGSIENTNDKRDNVSATNSLSENDSSVDRMQKTITHEDKKYIVDVNGGFIAPPFCACCMKETKDRKDKMTFEARSSTRSTSRRATYSFSVDLPLCWDCRLHQLKAQEKRKNLVIICIIIGLVLHIATTIITKGQYGLAYVVGIFGSVLLYVLFSLFVKLEKLSDEHSERMDYVKIDSPDLPSGMESTGSIMTHRNAGKPIRNIQFTFTNRQFAELLYLVNKENSTGFKEVNCKNHVRSALLFPYALKNIGEVIGISFLSNSVLIVPLILLTLKSFH